MKIRKQIPRLILLCLPFLFACETSVVFQQQKAIPSEGWHYRDSIIFEASIHDTVALHAMHLDIRNTVDYRYSNLFVFLDIEFPDGMVLRDTLECILADRQGNWTGKGFGKIRTNRFLFRDDVWFPQQGVYTFRIFQGMREDRLQGIADVGIRIEKK